MDLGVAAAAAVHALVERRETLAVAESLTGGLLAATIVEIPGVSAVFRGGLVVYATDLKHTLAGVPERRCWPSADRSTRTWRVALADRRAASAAAPTGRLATTGVAGPRPAGRQAGRPGLRRGGRPARRDRPRAEPRRLRASIRTRERDAPRSSCWPTELRAAPAGLRS